MNRFMDRFVLHSQISPLAKGQTNASNINFSLSLTYKVLTATQPSYLHDLISLQRPRRTRSSSVVTLYRPSTTSSLKITDRSFRYATPRLCNQLPDLFRHPHQSCLDSLPHQLVNPSLDLIIPALIVCHSFTPGLKPTFSTNPSHLRLLNVLDCLRDNGTGPHAHQIIFSFTF